MRVTGMLCPPSSHVMEPPPPPCALVPGLLFGWLLVFGLLGWLLRWLVGCWLIGSGTAEFGWLVGWLVCWLVRWLVGCRLVVGCMCAYCQDTCCVALLHSVPVCMHAIARVFGVLCTFHFGVLARCSSGVLGSEAALLQRR